MGKHYLALHTLTGTTDKVQITKDFTTWDLLGSTTGYTHVNRSMGVIDETTVVCNVKQGASSAGPAFALFKKDSPVFLKYLGSTTQFVCTCGDPSTFFVYGTLTKSYTVNVDTHAMTTITYNKALTGYVYDVADVSSAYGKPTIAIATIVTSGSSYTCYINILDIATKVISQVAFTNFVNACLFSAKDNFIAVLGTDAAKNTAYNCTTLPPTSIQSTLRTTAVAQSWYVCANKDTSGNYFTLSVEKFNTGFSLCTNGVFSHKDPGGIAKPLLIAPWDNGAFIVSSAQNLYKIEIGDTAVVPTLMYTVPTGTSILAMTSREFGAAASTGGTPANPYLITRDMI